MVEEILPGLYRIEVPLPRNPLKALNSYVIKGQGRFLIIDTGMNRKECLRPMLDSLKRLDVDLHKADFFITHFHADHLGLAATLATETSKVYLNKTEASMMMGLEFTKEGWQDYLKFYFANGFPKDELERSLESHPGYRYSSRQRVDFSAVEEGDTIEIGDYFLKCVDTPGHTPGHMCLYEARKKILVSGDHILFDITPNITWWLGLENSLKQYLASLEKVYSLDVSLVLPGHRSIWNNHRVRITELQKHHENRLAEVLSTLESGKKTAWEVAPYITWDIDCSSWQEFPPAQKWFAFGETIAHLEYLAADGRIRKDMQNHKVLYSLV